MYAQIQTPVQQISSTAPPRISHTSCFDLQQLIQLRWPTRRARMWLQRQPYPPTHWRQPMRQRRTQNQLLNKRKYYPQTIPIHIRPRFGNADRCQQMTHQNKHACSFTKRDHNATRNTCLDFHAPNCVSTEAFSHAGPLQPTVLQRHVQIVSFTHVIVIPKSDIWKKYVSLPWKIIFSYV